jgi:hypothetical protein
MFRLPSLLAAVYRPATDHEISSWSFGVVKGPRNPGAMSWQARRGTLDDQAIFGPVQDFYCVCGNYREDRYRGMICDRCGVKVTTREVRRQRFGHLILPVAVPHPLGAKGERIFKVPVLPAVFWEAPAGERLARVYDSLARTLRSWDGETQVSPHPGSSAGTTGSAGEVLAAELSRLVDLLLPVVHFAHEWNLAEGPTLARGLALQRRGEDS